MNFINRLPKIFAMRGQDVGEAGKRLAWGLARGQQLLNSPYFLKKDSKNPFKNIFFPLHCIVSETEKWGGVGVKKIYTFRAKI